MLSRSRAPDQREGPSQDVPGWGGSVERYPRRNGPKSQRNPRQSPCLGWFKLPLKVSMCVCVNIYINIYTVYIYIYCVCVYIYIWIQYEYQSTLTPCWEIGAFDLMLTHLFRRFQATVGQPSPLCNMHSNSGLPRLKQKHPKSLDSWHSCSSAWFRLWSLPPHLRSWWWSRWGPANRSNCGNIVNRLRFSFCEDIHSMFSMLNDKTKKWDNFDGPARCSNCLDPKIYCRVVPACAKNAAPTPARMPASTAALAS